MKNLLLILLIVLSLTGYGQVNSVIPPEVNNFYNNAMRTVNPSIKNFIETSANNLKGRTVNIDSLSKAIQKDKLLKNANRREIDALTVLIMVQASKNADTELKNLVINMNREGKEAKNQSSQKAEIILANKSQIAENVSLVSKDIPFSSESLLTNLR